MKIFFFLFFIFNSFTFSADLLNFYYNNDNYNFCIKNYSIADNTLNFTTYNDENHSVPMNNISEYSIKNGYLINSNNECIFSDSITSNYDIVTKSELNIKDLSALGLDNYDLTFLLALSGLMTSFLFLFGIFRWI